MTAKDRGVVVRIVADVRQAQGKHSEVPLLLARGIKVRLSTGQGRGLMHHKFANFDRELLVTGSYNWTDSAERANRENALFVNDLAVIQRYHAEFERLFQGATTASVRNPR